MKSKRQSTVEPVFGTLTLGKINTIGIKQTNKVMYMAAIAYNLKKYLKFNSKVVTSDTQSLPSIINHQIQRLLGEISCFKPSKNNAF